MHDRYSHLTSQLPTTLFLLWIFIDLTITGLFVFFASVSSYKINNVFHSNAYARH